MAQAVGSTREKVLLALLLASLGALAFVFARGRSSVHHPDTASSASAAPDGKREWTTIEKGMVSQYLAANKVRRLQVGAGGQRLSGWLNTDIEPAEGEVYLDATETFPFADETFQYVYAEQLIEHLPYEKAGVFLRESRRVLVRGGKIRLATPNLLRLLALFDAEKTAVQQKLLDFQIETNRLSRTPLPETVTLNLFVRAWGHQFLYDPKSLRATFEAAGFIDVTERDLGVSDDADLRDIEQHWKFGGKDLDRYTSMYVEATRP